MVYEQILKLIQRICQSKSTDFQNKAIVLGKRVLNLSRKDILVHLLEAGVISERFGHDSTEEKLYAKYCNYLLSRSLLHLGIKSRVIEGRGNAPDVLGKVANKYTLAGDAKAFRLSRTAKNQKDFKVEALNTWRKDAEADYACLVAPLYQYPLRSSQIYDQAIRYNVTLISYTHLYFMVKTGSGYKLDWGPLWKTGKNLKPTQDANNYWDAINGTVCTYLKIPLKAWEQAREEAQERLPKQANIEISFWKSEKQRIMKLSHEKAVKQLIKALKIDSKINVIRRTAGI